LRWKKRAASFAACALALCLLAPSAWAGRDADARQFVESLADQAIHSLAVNDISRAERIKRFQTLFDKNFAVDAIGKWILGRYWRQATPAQQSEYLKLFQGYIVASYVDRFAAYTGEALKITKVVDEDNGPVTVFSELLRPGEGNTPVRVDWRLEGADQHLRIVDLVVEGISMSTTLRSDFGSIIRRDGGDISGLLDVLRKKTATLETTN
jgi:phospholipid transport system substrate-binding protein